MRTPVTVVFCNCSRAAARLPRSVHLTERRRVQDSGALPARRRGQRARAAAYSGAAQRVGAPGGEQLRSERAEPPISAGESAILILIVGIKLCAA